MGIVGRHRRGYAGLLLVSVALIAAGCGGDGDEDATTGTSASEPETTSEAQTSAASILDAGYEGVYEGNAVACELLTDEDVSAVLGGPAKSELVVEGNEKDGTPSQCRWSSGASTDLANPGSRPTEIQVNAAGESWFDSSAGLYEDDQNFEVLEGIGDDAWAGGGTAGVLIGEAGITVQAFGLPADDPKLHDASIELLEAVVANY